MRKIKSLLISIVIVVCATQGLLVSGCAKAQEQNENKAIGVSDSSKTVHIVGEQQATQSFSANVDRVAEASKPMDEGKALFGAGKYLEAKEKFKLSLKLYQENKIQEWLPRWRLAEVYEKLGDKQNALEQLDWLIQHCQNEETKNELKVRKNNLRQ